MLYFIMIFSFFSVVFATDHLVTIKNGQIQGFERKTGINNKTFIAFEGIPYAAPPVDNLRFEEAQPVENWEGTLIANKQIECLQLVPLPARDPIVRGKEDCLYINVYTSNLNPEANLDVIVHIHGGAFILGSPLMMAAPDYIMTKDFVFVAFTYRLNLFGFLSTEDKVVPGNIGLKDQLLALKWIKTNIKNFGGNPDSITLTGLSAGSASVHFHFLTPKTKGLFHRGMCFSGTVLNPWALAEKPLRNAQKLGKEMECPTESTKELVQCLKGKDARELMKGMKILFEYQNIFPIAPFAPVVDSWSDDPYIEEHPYKTLSQGNIANDVPMIISVTKEEGIFPVGIYFLFSIYENFVQNWDKYAIVSLDLQDVVPETKFEEIAEKIKKFYFGNEEMNRTNNLTLVKVYSDRLFFLSIELAARMHAKASKSKVYFSFNSYIPEHFIPYGINGTAHSDDSKMIFRLMISPKVLKGNDVTMTNFFTDLLHVYTQTDKPTVKGVDWTPIDPEKEKLDLLHIYSGSKYEMENILELAPKSFWKSFNIQENENLIL